MGQKVHPYGFRLGVIKDWQSKWFTKKDYADYLHEDLAIRKYLEKNLKNAEVGKVDIIRFPESIQVDIYTSRPGIVIGKKGADVENLKRNLQTLSAKKIQLYIHELKSPETTSKLVAENIARQIEGRISYKRAMKQSIQNAMKNGAKGIKVHCSGRLAGAEMARAEKYKEGRIPLQTLRADVDYGFAEALTTFGKVGVKVWIFKGEILDKDKEKTGSDSHMIKRSRGRDRGRHHSGEGSRKHADA